jgi:hypothetical protein
LVNQCRGAYCCPQKGAVLQHHTGGAIPIDLDPFHRRIVQKAHPMRLRDPYQTIDNTVDASYGQPYPIRQFGVLHQRIGGRSIERTQPQIHVLEGEGRLEMRVSKVVADVVVVLDQRFQLEEQLQVLQAEVIEEVIEVAPHKAIEAEMVRLVSFHEIVQQGFRVLDQLDSMAQAHCAAVSKVALAWVMALPGITAAIASVTLVEQLYISYSARLS